MGVKKGGKRKIKRRGGRKVGAGEMKKGLEKEKKERKKHLSTACKMRAFHVANLASRIQCLALSTEPGISTLPSVPLQKLLKYN